MPFVYVIPNNPTAIRIGTKFKLLAEDAFDPYGFVSARVNVAVERAARDHEEYGQGSGGFGNRYGAEFADEAISEVFSAGL